MAKKSDPKPTAGTPGRKVAGKENSLSPGERVGVRAGKKDSLATSDGERVDEVRVRARPSSLLDTRALKKTGSFYYHCDWHASHYVKVMLDQIFGAN
jgi:hypothetical protein